MNALVHPTTKQLYGSCTFSSRFACFCIQCFMWFMIFRYPKLLSEKASRAQTSMSLLWRRSRSSYRSTPVLFCLIYKQFLSTESLPLTMFQTVYLFCRSPIYPHCTWQTLTRMTTTMTKTAKCSPSISTC